MKAVCQNIFGECDYCLYEKVFKVRNIGKGSCPNCGSSDIAPAWIREFKFSGEQKARENIIKVKKEIQAGEERIEELRKKREKMNLRDQQIRDKACTICDGIYPSGRAKSKIRCDTCRDGSNWRLGGEK